MQNSSKFYCIYILSFSFLLYWCALFFAQINDKTYFVPGFTSACYLLNMDPYPQLSVLRRRIETQFSYTTQVYNKSNCLDATAGGKWEHVRRPIVGDHIHLGMVLSVNNHVYNFHDRNMSQPIAYEVDGTCPNPGKYAYEKRWYHTGVHTHCDGNIIHVHPWSAPNELRVEGRDVKLKLWFESVGIEVSPDKTGLKLPGQKNYITDWEMEYYVHVSDRISSFRTKNVEKMVNLWLVDHHGEILLWSGGDKPRKDFRVIEYKSHPINYPNRYN